MIFLKLNNVKRQNFKKVSDIVAEILIEEKGFQVFAISGGASLHLIHSLADNQYSIYL